MSPLTETHQDGQDKQMPIAIVGMSCRFPGEATDPNKFWDMLANGRTSWSEIPSDRFNIDTYYHPHVARQGAVATRGGNFLKEDVGLFDAPFFSITANEAEAIDPQQRMLLELAFESLENAGIPMDRVVGSDTSCYVGAFTGDYENVAGKDINNMKTYQAIGSGRSILSNRLSWFYDLHGPSLTLDTACSSSLVGFHLACQSLRTGESTMSLVGGTNLILLPEIMRSLSALHFLSPDGKCFSFDHRANGYSRGEGSSVMILKPLDAALRDGDTIRAVVRGSGVNQDGKTPGITLPSLEAQARLIRSTYSNAGLPLSDTDYFEAHGTGTAAGDPLEVGAIGKTLGVERDPSHPLYIGSVKANIGHLEGCSGLAGILKTVLILETGFIPPQANFEKVNPNLHLEDWNLAVPTSQVPWPTDGPRRASVNSFGYGGTNAHVILDDAFHYLRDRGLKGNHHTKMALESPTPSTSSDSGIGTEEDSLDFMIRSSQRKLKLLVFSSPEQNGLQRIGTAYSEHLKGLSPSFTKYDSQDYIRNLAYTLANRRSLFAWRSFAVAESTDTLLKSLDEGLPKFSRSSKPPKLGFVFTGQGAQWFAMGRELLAYQIFSNLVLEADEYLKSLGCPWSVIAELLKDETTTNVNQTTYSQPLCTILQVALIELTRSWGIEASRVVGHSSGEIGAAYCIGAITKQNAWKIAYFRGLLSAEIHGRNPNNLGAMMAVGLSTEQVKSYLPEMIDPRVVIACINSPSNITLSGDKTSILELATRLKSDNIQATILKVDIAYHSTHMNHIAEDYLASIEDIKPFEVNSTPMFSSVTGQQIASTELGPSYWVRNLVSPVNFLGAVNSMLAPAANTRRRNGPLGVDVLLEFGPHAALQGPLKQILNVLEKDKNSVHYVPILRRGNDAVQTSLEAAGKLWCKGYNVKFDLLNSPTSDFGEVCPLVDIPNYPWNHTNRYWHESTTSYNRRFNIYPRLDLLGKPSENCNPHEPVWLNVLQISENPWIQDHVVQDSILYPAAGMLVMAIEAARQLSDKDKAVHGFELRDIVIGHALVLKTSDAGVETMLQIRPHRIGTRATTSTWLSFGVFSMVRGESWVENCSGLISIKYETASSEVEGEPEAAVEWQFSKEEFRAVKEGCIKKIVPQHFYKRLREMGLQFGPLFQNVTQIDTGRNMASCSVIIPDTKSIMPEMYEYDHLIHPATLDGFIQTIFAATNDNARHRGAMVPTSIDSVFVSAKFPKTVHTELTGFTKVTSMGQRESAGFVTFSDVSWDSPMVTIKGLKCTELATTTVGGTSESDGSSNARKICAHIEWKQDVEHLSHIKEQALLIEDNLPANKDRVLRYNQLEKVSVIYMKRALAELRPDITEAMSPHLKLYLAWMQRQYMQAREGLLSIDGDSSWLDLSQEEENRLMAWAREESIDGRLMCTIGENLLPIFSGEVDPLSLMMEDNMLIQYYSESVGIKELNNIVGLWFDKAGHKNPNIRVLEIGGGSASATKPVLAKVGGHDGVIPRVEKYVFTDISTGFFPSAQTALAEWSSLVEYKALDIEEDPEEQGFEAESFDVILASNVLHATKSLDKTLGHCKKLLKPGGQIVIMEFTRPANNVSLIYGTLKGWWFGEDDNRKFGPIAEKSEWDRRLKCNGFNGVEFSLQDTGALESHLVDVMVSKVPLQPPQDTAKTVIILQPTDASSSILNLGENLSTELRLCGFDVNTSDIGSLSEVKDSYVISLLEVDQLLLANWTSEQFSKFKDIALQSAGLLWITKGGGQMGNTTQPEANIAIGLIRVIRAETPHLRLPTLDISDELLLASPDAKRCIMQVFDSVFVKGGADFEYAEFGSSLHIPRITEETNMNKVLSQLVTAPVVTEQPLHQGNRHLKLDIGVPGMLDTLRFVDDPEPFTPLGPKDVEFAVEAAALNFRDIMISMAQISDTGFGSDSTGRVTRVGEDVTQFKIGQLVYTIAMGSCRTMMRCTEDFVKAVPDKMSPEIAASLPTVVATAYFALCETARLERGETVLIHAASGGLGQIAIQIAQNLGAVIFATVGSMAKKELLIGKYGIPQDHIFNSRDLTFAKGVMRMTENRGVDVVLNSSSGEALRQTWLCTAPFGRFIEVGKKDMYGNTGLDMAPFLRNITFASVNLEEIQHYPKKLVHVLSKSAELMTAGIVREAYPTTIMNFSDTEKAFRTMQTGKHSGKLVLKANEDDMVPCMPPILHPLKLDPEATYVLVGGLGGLGRSIATWMITQGARNIAFISRSGGTSDLAQEFLKSLRRQRVNALAYACDICESESLQKVVDKIASDMPTVRGLIQGAMVLKDVIFENMTYEDWLTTTRPKIKGSWNLHSLFPKELDFFILLSSTAGVIGNPGQGNYCAGNTYQDALAQYRRVQGLTGTAIDLGAMKDVGWLAEHSDVKTPLMEIYEDELHLLISSAMSGYTHDEARMPPQLIVGLGSGLALDMNDVTMWWLEDPKFWHLKKGDAQASSTVVDTVDMELRQSILAVSNLADGVKAIENALVVKLAKSMMISPEDINVEKPISTYGVDSLVAVEVRNWIFRELKADVSVFDLLSQVPISALAFKLAEKSKLISQQLKTGSENGEEPGAQAPSE